MVLYLNEDILKESLSKTIYHFTSLQNLLKIYSTENLYLQCGLRGGGSDSYSKDKLFYLCFTRVMDGRFGYSAHLPVRIEFDGEALSYNYTGKPIDYWGASMGKQYYFKDAKERNKPIDNIQHNTENEDRLFSKEPVIRDVLKYIKRVDLLVNRENTQEMAIAYKLSYKDNVYIYDNRKDFDVRSKNIINNEIRENYQLGSEYKEPNHYIFGKRATECGVTNAVNFILFWECDSDKLKENAAKLLKEYGLEKYISYVIKHIGKTYHLEDVINEFVKISDDMLSNGIKEDYVLTMRMIRDYCIKHKISDRRSAYLYKKQLGEKAYAKKYGNYNQYDYQKTLTTLVYIDSDRDLRIDENGIATRLYGVTILLHPEKTSIWSIRYFNENVRYLFKDGDLAYYINSHKSKNEEYLKKYLKHLALSNKFTVNDFIKFIENVDMDEDYKQDYLLNRGHFDTIKINCWNSVGKYPDCTYVSEEEKEEVEEYFTKLNENKNQIKKIYITEDKLSLLKESNDFFSVPQIRYNGDYYLSSDEEAIPFVQLNNGQIIYGKNSSDHDQNRNITKNYEDWLVFGRIFFTEDDKIIIVICSADFQDDAPVNSPFDRKIISQVVSDKNLDKNKVYYYVDAVSKQTELTKFEKEVTYHSNPMQRNLGKMTLAQYHSLLYQENKTKKDILKENISSVVYHFTDFESFENIAKNNSIKLSKTNDYSNANSDFDKNDVNKIINGDYKWYLSFTRSPNSKLGFSQWFNDNPEEFGSPGTDGMVRIEFDGDLFNQRKDKKNKPIDFFSTQFRNANNDLKFNKKSSDSVIIPKDNKNTSSKETQLNSLKYFDSEIKYNNDHDNWYDDREDKKNLKKHTHPSYVQNEDRFMTNSPDKIIGEDGFITNISKYITRVDIFLHNTNLKNKLTDLIRGTQLGKEGKIHIINDIKKFDTFSKDENMRINSLKENINDISIDVFKKKCQEIFSNLENDINEYLKNINPNLTVYLDNEYEDYDSMNSKNWVACYEKWSVFNGEIQIVLNYESLLKGYQELNEESWETDTKITIWHEVGHGIVEYVNDILTNTDEYDTLYDNNQARWDWILDNEENAVEQFGEYMSDYGTYSELNDIIQDISNLY